MNGGVGGDVALPVSVWTWILASAFSLLAAGWLATIGWGVRAVRQLVVLLSAMSLFYLANGFALAGATVPVPWFVLAIATLVQPAAVISFYTAFHGGQNWRRTVVAMWPITGLVILVTLLVPSLWTGAGAGFGFLFVVYGLNYLLFAALAFELTRDAVHEEQDPEKRRSMLWLALGLSFLPAYAAASELFFVDIFKLNQVTGAPFLIAHYLSVGAGLVLTAMFIILARSVLRTEKDEQKVDVAWFMAVVIGPLFSVLILSILEVRGSFDAQMSVAMEGIWAAFSPLFISLAVARFSSFGLARNSQPGLRRFLFAVLWPILFGLGWMAAMNSFDKAWPPLVGLIFVALALPFYKSLWRLCGFWAGKILGVEGENVATEASNG